MSDLRVRTACNLQTICWFTQKRLIDLDFYNETTVFIGVLPEDNWVPPNVDYAVINPGEQVMINPETGDGTPTFEGRLQIRLNFRQSLDVGMRSYTNITQPSGVTKKINQVIQALHLWDMTNGAWYYLAEPMRYINQTKITKTEVGKNLQWASVDLFFNIKYGEDPTFENPEVDDVREYTNGYDGGFQ